MVETAGLMTEGHGTGVASVSLVAAIERPSPGVMGLAPDVKILPFRFKPLRATKIGRQLGTRRFNMPWTMEQKLSTSSVSGKMPVSSEEAAVSMPSSTTSWSSREPGILGSGPKNYPAAYPGVVSVGGSDKTGHVWKDSSWVRTRHSLPRLPRYPVVDTPS